MSSPPPIHVFGTDSRRKIKATSLDGTIIIIIIIIVLHTKNF